MKCSQANYRSLFTDHCSLKARRIRQAAEQQQQQCFLAMHAVFGLIEDDGLRAVEHFVGDFSIAARGQAVHEDRMGSGFTHQRFVHLEGSEDRLALGGLVLEAMLTHTSV